MLGDVRDRGFAAKGQRAKGDKTVDRRYLVAEIVFSNSSDRFVTDQYCDAIVRGAASQADTIRFSTLLVKAMG